MHDTWTAATAALRDALDATTLAQLAQRDADIESGRYAIPADSHRN